VRVRAPLGVPFMLAEVMCGGTNVDFPGAMPVPAPIY